MSIKPQYSRAILAGDKRVEFRKRRLAQDVKVVLIYESRPTMRVVGQFTIHESIVDSPARLWENFAECGGITKEDFDAYYAGKVEGTVLRIEAAKEFDIPLTLADLPGRPGPPQSFRYLPNVSLPSDPLAEAGLTLAPGALRLLS